MKSSNSIRLVAFALFRASFCALLLTLFALPACAQQFVFTKALGGSNGDYGNSLVQSQDGGHVVVGVTHSFGSGNADILLSKFNVLGDTLWNIVVGGSRDDWGNSVILTNDGGYTVAGETRSFGVASVDVFLSNFDTAGTPVWTRTLGGDTTDYGKSLIQTADGGYVVTGYTQSSGAGPQNVLISKFDGSGNHQWTKTEGWTGAWSLGSCIARSRDGGFVIAGESDAGSGGWTDVLISKFDASGNHQWTRLFGGNNYDYGRTVIQTQDGGFVITGFTRSFGAGSFDMLLSKFDPVGTHLWTRTVDWGRDDYGISVKENSTGLLIVVGYYTNTSGNADVVLCKFDASGNPIVAVEIGGTRGDYGRSVIQASDGGYVVTGNSWSYGVGMDDLLLAKFDARGVNCDCAFMPLNVTNQNPTVSISPPQINSWSPTIRSQSPPVNHWSPTLTTMCQSSNVEGDGVRNREVRIDLNIIPNPFSSFASVPGHEAERFALYDVAGRNVGIYRGDRIGEGLAPGVYFISPEGRNARPLRVVKVR